MGRGVPSPTFSVIPGKVPKFTLSTRSTALPPSPGAKRKLGIDDGADENGSRQTLSSSQKADPPLPPQPQAQVGGDRVWRAAGAQVSCTLEHNFLQLPLKVGFQLR